MSRFRVTLVLVILVQGVGVVSADSYTISLSSGVIPGAESAEAYRIPAFADLGVHWWPDLAAGYGALATSLMVALFIPDDDTFGRSVLLAPLAGFRAVYPVGESGFLLGAELAAGMYARWSRIENRDRLARRPVTRATMDFLFRDAWGWESGIRAGWIGWYDERPIHSGTIAVIVGRRW